MAASKVDETPSCSITELMAIITAPSQGLTMLPSDDLNEVWPNLFVGDSGSAKNRFLLTKCGVTHVLNAASGKSAYHVQPNEPFYTNLGIDFLAIEATDDFNFKISVYFDECSDFIHKALEGGGKVLVHCREGVSRSSTIVLAYLMMNHHMTAQDAMRLVRRGREVCPNDGFLQQLCDLNDRLLGQGHFNATKVKVADS